MQNSIALKEKIIKQSLELFSLKGFLSTSIHDIMREAKASKGGLCNHFESKDDIFFPVLSEARKIWRERNLSSLDQIEKPVAKVKKLRETYREVTICFLRNQMGLIQHSNVCLT